MFSIPCQEQLGAVLDELAVVDGEIRKQEGLNLGRRKLLAHLEYLSFTVEASSHHESLLLWMEL